MMHQGTNATQTTLTLHPESLVASLGCSSLALAGTLCATLHFPSREVAQITTGRSITALGMALLASESKLGVLLLALATTFTATLLGLASFLNGNIEHIFGVVGRGRGISLALCRND